jgi:hypothetical protein
MQTALQIDADELDEKFVDSIKALFKHKKIEITVNELDETDYLLRSTENREHLLGAAEDVGAGRNLVVPDQDRFQY